MVCGDARIMKRGGFECLYPSMLKIRSRGILGAQFSNVYVYSCSLMWISSLNQITMPGSNCWVPLCASSRRNEGVGLFALPSPKKGYLKQYREKWLAVLQKTLGI